jgi:hypothetical protein
MLEQAGDVQLSPSTYVLPVVGIYEAVVQVAFRIRRMIFEPLFKQYAHAIPVCASDSIQELEIAFREAGRTPVGTFSVAEQPHRGRFVSRTRAGPSSAVQCSVCSSAARRSRRRRFAVPAGVAATVAEAGLMADQCFAGTKPVAVWAVLRCQDDPRSRHQQPHKPR